MGSGAPNEMNALYLYIGFCLHPLKICWAYNVLNLEKPCWSPESRDRQASSL